MHWIRLAIISIVVFFLLLLAFAALIPAQVRISRAINISASPQRISAMTRNGSRWNGWNEFVKPLHHAVLLPGQITSDELRINISGTGDSVVNMVWRQRNGKTFPAVIRIIGQGPFTIVQWYFDFTLRWYPWEKFGSIVYDKQLGPMMEQSLTNLKQVAEQTE